MKSELGASGEIEMPESAVNDVMEDESERAPLVGDELSVEIQTASDDIADDSAEGPIRLPQICGLLVGTICMLSSGTLYAFGGYSDELKVSLGWTESQMELVGYMGDCGVYLAGPFTGSLQDMYGPRLACIVSAFLVAVGYGSMAYAVATKVTTSPIVHGFFLALAGSGSGLMYVSALSSNILLFPTRFRGKLVGLLVSLYGLSALVFTSIYKGLLGGELPERLLACMAIACGSAGLLGSVLLTKSLRSAGRMKWDSAIVSEQRSFMHQIGGIGAAFYELFRSPICWLLMAVFFLMAGNGLMIINNLSSMAKSLNPAAGESMIASLVALMSICNCLGRLVSGVVSDMLTWRRGVFFWIASLLFVASGMIYAFLAASTSKMLYLLVVGIGLGYGTMWSILPTCVSEVFGAASFGQNWGCMLLAPALGALFFNSIAGYVYDSYSGPSGTCEGLACYRVPVLLVAGSAVAAALLTIPLIPKTFRGRPLSDAVMQ